MYVRRKSIQDNQLPRHLQIAATGETRVSDKINQMKGKAAPMSTPTSTSSSFPISLFQKYNLKMFGENLKVLQYKYKMEFLYPEKVESGNGANGFLSERYVNGDHLIKLRALEETRN